MNKIKCNNNNKKNRYIALDCYSLNTKKGTRVKFLIRKRKKIKNGSAFFLKHKRESEQKAKQKMACDKAECK